MLILIGALLNTQHYSFWCAFLSQIWLEEAHYIYSLLYVFPVIWCRFRFRVRQIQARHLALPVTSWRILGKFRNYWELIFLIYKWGQPPTPRINMDMGWNYIHIYTSTCVYQLHGPWTCHLPLLLKPSTWAISSKYKLSAITDVSNILSTSLCVFLCRYVASICSGLRTRVTWQRWEGSSGQREQQQLRYSDL